MPRKPRIVTDPNLVAVANLVHLLERGMHDMRELAEQCGLTYLSVSRYCAAFHRARAVHIAGWKADPRGAFTIRIYELGEGVDAIAPAVTRAEKARRMRIGRKKLREEFERRGEFNVAVAAALRHS